jgi:hypothetical protein
MIYLIWILCAVYCVWRLTVRYKKSSIDGVIGASPGLDTLMVILLAPLLAIIDISLTWIRMVKDAEEAKRRAENFDLGKQLLNEEDKDSIY